MLQQTSDNPITPPDYYKTVLIAAGINLLSYAVILVLPILIASRTFLKGEGGLLFMPLLFILVIIHFAVSYIFSSRYLAGKGIAHARRIAALGTLASCLLGYIGTFAGYFGIAALARNQKSR